MRRVPLGLLLMFSLSAPAAAQSDAPELIGVRALSERLVALDPKEPMMYFELAEEVASELRHDRGEQLASALYVLAYDLSRESQGIPTLTRHVCLALAELEGPDSERRPWLLAIASLQETSESTQNRDSVAQREARETIATALSYYTAEDYLKARIQFNRPQAVRYINALRGNDRQLLDDIIETTEAEASCVVCQNRRTVRSRSTKSGGAPDELCTRCAGNPGPRLSEDEYRRTIRFEIDLFEVPSTSWSAQLDRDGAKPLREADPDQLAPLYDVDPRATTFVLDENGSWRNGTWAIPPEKDPTVTPGS